MTVTTCDLCGRVMNKVNPGITYRGESRGKDNNARLDLIWQDGDSRHYDLCVDCSEKLINMFERKKLEIQED